MNPGNPIKRRAVLFMLVVGLVCAGFAQVRPVFDANLVQTAPVRTLMPDGDLGLHYFPDGPLVVIHSNAQSGFRALVASGISSWLIQGSAVTNVTTAAQVLRPGVPNDFDNGYAGICGAWYDPTNGSLYVIYHAEDQQGMPSIGGVRGFYASVGVAVSTNNVASFTKLGAVITSARPKSWGVFFGQPDRGAGEPCCVLSRDGHFLYAYYTEHSRVNSRGVQICLARCDITGGPPTPGRWQKYYNGAFTEPGLGGNDTPVMSADDLDNANAIEPYVSFSPYLGKYIMLFGIDHWKENTNAAPGQSGIYVAYSDNGVAWSAPKQVIKDFAVPIPGKSVSWHAAMVWDSAQEQSGMMVWSYSPKWGGNAAAGYVPHYMVGQRVGFVKNSP